ncbi:aminoglycoside phosphotransferase (APT) family kinase protein [Pseudacidovorax sp. 1753]|uniref:phosphotransferase n=1 Tax=Pseudacidovorax sp. 1753 TaxID=3156419 RepID=UPI0033999E05
MSGMDVARLAACLRVHLGPFEGPLAVRAVEGGQSNPTFLVDAGAARYVLRRKPTGSLLPSAHAVEREYRVMQALEGSAVPVPRVRLLCEDAEVIGSAFYLMDFVEGRILTDQTLPGMAPSKRRAHYDALNRTIAALHGIAPESVGLGDYGRGTQYVQRQIARWTRQYRSAQTQRIEAMESLIEWLPVRVPPQAGTGLVHGDFRLDNVIFHPSEPRIVAVLDWELSTLGDPLADFAYHCLNWRIGLGVHRTLAGLDDAQLRALGIPTEAEHLVAYCARTGLGTDEAIAHWPFYLAFNLFRLAAIQQGIARRALDGNAANRRAADVAARVEATAAEGWRVAAAVPGRASLLTRGF